MMDDFVFQDTSDLRNDEIYLKIRKTVAANPDRKWVPYYDFAICSSTDDRELGHCDLRIGHSDNLYFGGNIGYTIHEDSRGRRFSTKACLLLFDLARRHNMNYLYISCNTDNYASRKTCEYAGGTLLEIADLPPDNDMYLDGERQKCIYYFSL